MIFKDDALYRKALWEKYVFGVKHRDCSIRLDQLTQNDILEATRTKKRLLLPTLESVRSNVSWLPVQSTKENSASTLSELAVYREQNGFEPALHQINKRRYRTKSMIPQSTNQPDKTNTPNLTLDDMHSELAEKYNSPRPSSLRQLTELQTKPLSDNENFFIELRAKFAEKITKK